MNHSKVFFSAVGVVTVALLVMGATLNWNGPREYKKLAFTSTDDATYSGITNDDPGTNIIYSLVDTNSAQPRNTFYTRGVSVGEYSVIQAYFKINALDTNYGLDSAYIRLMTSMNHSDTMFNRIVKSDSFLLGAAGANTYKYYAYINETLFFADCWFELIISDSCNNPTVEGNPGSGYDADSLERFEYKHKYRVEAAINQKVK